MRIVIVGAGYRGLLLGTCLASVGYEVTLVDADLSRVESLTSGRCYIEEPVLKEFISELVHAGRLHAVSCNLLSETIRQADVIFFSIPSPRTTTHAVDWSILTDIGNHIGKYLQRDSILVNTIASEVGATEILRRAVQSSTEHQVEVAYCDADIRFDQADRKSAYCVRLIIGTTSKRAENILQKLFDPLLSSAAGVLVMNVANAELCGLVNHLSRAEVAAFEGVMRYLSAGTGYRRKSVVEALVRTLESNPFAKLPEEAYKRVMAMFERAYVFYFLSAIAVVSLLFLTAALTIVLGFMGKPLPAGVFGSFSAINLLTSAIWKPHKKLKEISMLRMMIEHAWISYIQSIEICRVSPDPETCIWRVNEDFLTALQQNILPLAANEKVVSKNK